MTAILSKKMTKLKIVTNYAGFYWVGCFQQSYFKNWEDQQDKVTKLLSKDSITLACPDENNNRTGHKK